MLSSSLHIVCLIFLISGSAYAQTAVEGTVRNSAGQPVPNASVSLQHQAAWRGFWAGSAMRYGSGTIIEHGPRLPQHFTSDLAAGMTLWKTAPRYLDLEFDITNVSNSIYKIAKESEEIPIQYAPSPTVGGSLKFHF